VPDGSVLPKDSAKPLKLPPVPAPRNMVPVWVAAGGLGGALLLAGLLFGGAVLMRKTAGRPE
jgi:membrane-anchored mycosin MYCP